MFPIFYKRSSTKPTSSQQQPEPPRKSPGLWLTLVAVAMVTAAAGAARLYATTHFSYSHPDESIAIAVISHVFQTHEDDTDWGRTDVSKTFRYDQYNFSSYYLFAAYVEELGGQAANDLEHPSGAMLKHLRNISAVLGALCVLFAGILGWRLGGSICAITTCLLTACSASLFQDSIYARPETFVTLLTLLLCLMLTSEKTHRGLVLTVAGFLIGILISCKITFLIYFPFPLLLAPTLLSTPEDKDPKNPHLIYWTASLGAYFLALLVGFYVGAPYAVRYPWEYLNGLEFLFKQYTDQGGANSVGLLGHLSNSTGYLIYAIGYPALLLAILGIVRLTVHKDIRKCLIISGPLLTLVYFMQTDTFFERNFSQALPILFIMAGFGIRSLADMIGKRDRLRFATATGLIIASAVVPLSVTAKAIDPALDGRYQREAEAKGRALTEDGNLMLFHLWGVGQIGVTNGNLCGAYLYEARDFGTTMDGTLQKLLRKGYRLEGKLQSPFGNNPGSTLQAYLAPSMVYIAPPDEASSRCSMILSPLKAIPGTVAIPTKVVQKRGWMKGGVQISPPPSWKWPIYGSWSGSDGNTGTIQIGPFRACGEFVFPYTAGRSFSGMSLKVVRQTPSGDETLFDGELPVSPPDWEQITVRQAPHTCATYTITGAVASTDGRDWMGLGSPIAIKRPAQQ
ncbi:MAG TPA: hypothetical protein VFK21_03870 [Gammaproteobacteria bacterium]|nr:hypothetical protein [Gammaproteobacteria bacterium]